MTSVVVAGALANKPRNGGEAWVRLSWVLGLRRLGCRVRFVEQIDAGDCVDGAGNVVPCSRSINLSYFRTVVEKFGLTDSASLLVGDDDHFGMRREAVERALEESDVLVNISGHLRDESLLERARTRAYVDIDPGFTQYWHIQRIADLGLESHDVHFTIAENVGSPACSIPQAGIQWRTVRQPVVLAEWPVASDGRPTRFTTVATWRGPYGPITVDGRTFGLKVHEFRKLLDLPRRSAATFELALDIHPDERRDVDALAQHGWRLVDPRHVAGDPDSFRRYVATSGAEFSVAHGVYVETNSGWFSDRTIRYLAAGKPALVQDTGFSRTIPTGEGLLAFLTLDDAIAGAAQLTADYEKHRTAARAIAEEYFESDKVLSKFLDKAG